MRTLVGLARAGAQAIRLARESYRHEFQRVTARARQRFEQRAWSEAQKDAQDRLELYRQTLEAVVAELDLILIEHLRDPAVWRTMKEFYSDDIADLPDVELAETFFNSVTRHVFVTVGVDPNIEFVDLDIRRDRYGLGSTIHKRFERTGTTAELVERALTVFEFAIPYEDIARDADRVAWELDDQWRGGGREELCEVVEIIDHVFYRGSGAYLVGRARGGGDTVPVVIVLVHGAGGIVADALLATEREVSIVFSYTRSHFLVEAPRPADVVRFLASIMPRKPLAELYISLGFIKHGKTELYRGLMGHLGRSMDLFDHAPGDTGMVMICFTLPSYDYVFKVIRDEFAPPKTNTRADVLDKYELVFRHDRAGRLIEAQEFEHLIFDRRRFSDALLQELVEAASATVTVTGEEVHLRHLYIERRVHPLNLYLRDIVGIAADQVVRDYGQAIRDLATTNIFPGDMLLKNFGVTRHGRVTFYDYDELCLVTDCRFRELPTARDDGEEMAAEPWFYVDQHDIFPEEFIRFMGLNKHHRTIFLAEHGEVLTAEFWRTLQRRHRRGEVVDVFPYPAARRLGSA